MVLIVRIVVIKFSALLELKTARWSGLFFVVTALASSGRVSGWNRNPPAMRVGDKSYTVYKILLSL